MRKCGMRRFSESGNHSVLGSNTFSKFSQNSKTYNAKICGTCCWITSFGLSNPKDTSALLATFSALLGNLVSRLRGTPMYFFFNKQRWVLRQKVGGFSHQQLSFHHRKCCSRLSRTWLRTPMTYELPESTPWKHVPTVAKECFLATQTYFNGSL